MPPKLHSSTPSIQRPRLPVQGVSTSVRNAVVDDPGPWSYTTMGHLITHAARKCGTCSSWASHYMCAALDHEESIDAAIAQRDSAIQGSLLGELSALRASNDSLRHALDTVREDLTCTTVELEQLRNTLRDALADSQRAHVRKDELSDRARTTIDGLHDEIDSLQNRLRDLDSDDGSPRRKIPRYYSQASDPHDASGHLSNRTSAKIQNPGNAYKGS